jgi:hypothetical protein
MITREIIDDAFQTTMEQIKEAADRGDLAAVTVLARKATECKELKKSLIAFEERGEKILETVPINFGVAAPDGEVKLRELPVEVTNGMKKQNYLSLTPHIRQQRIQIGEDLTIEVQPNGERFRTQLLEKGNKLRERGAIARFYHDAKVQAGDFVVLTEVSPRQWTLKKALPGRYQSQRDTLVERALDELRRHVPQDQLNAVT